MPSASTVALRGHVGARLEVAELLAVLAAALVARADRRGPRRRRRAAGWPRVSVRMYAPRLLGPRCQPARQLGDADHVVAVVAERRRRRLQRQLRARGRASSRRCPWRRSPCESATRTRGTSGNSCLESRRAHHRAGQVVRAARLALLDHRHRHLAEALHQLRVVARAAAAAGSRRPARRAAADDHDADVDPLVLGVELALDELPDRVDRRRELARRDRPRPFIEAMPAQLPSWP